MNPDIDHLNKTVYCRLATSPVHGVGVFAIRDIPKGTTITDYSIHNIKDIRLLKVERKHFNKILPEIRELILDHTMFQSWQEEFFFYSPNYEVCLTSFMNHSEDPNSDGRVALRDIKAGEEVTENYMALLQDHKPHQLTKRHLKKEKIL